MRWRLDNLRIGGFQRTKSRLVKRADFFREIKAQECSFHHPPRFSCEMVKGETQKCGIPRISRGFLGLAFTTGQGAPVIVKNGPKS